MSPSRACENRSKSCATAGAFPTSTLKPWTISSSPRATSPPATGCFRSTSGGASAQANWRKSWGHRRSSATGWPAPSASAADGAEWRSYGPDTQAIATAFTNGINAYIRALGRQAPAGISGSAATIQACGTPEDCLARVAGLLMTRNLTQGGRARPGRPALRPGRRREASAARSGRSHRDPARARSGRHRDSEIVRVYNQATGPARSGEQGSNNWVVDGAMTATGKPILANDPHRPVQLPVAAQDRAPGGARMERDRRGRAGAAGDRARAQREVAFGFTIVGIDQQDLYVEKLNPANPNQYLYRGAWKDGRDRAAADCGEGREGAGADRTALHGARSR